MSKTKNKQPDTVILQMVQRAFGEKVTSDQILVKELTQGLYNVAYEVTLLNQSVILKIAPQKSAKVMSYEFNIMNAEVEALKLVKQYTSVPVPSVLFYDDSHFICDADYFFMDKIQGESFYTLCNEELLSSKEKAAIYKEIGRLNREVNEIKGSKFGYFGMKERQGIVWKSVFLDMIETVLQDGESIGATLGMEYNEIRLIIQQAAWSLESIKEPSFVHWDMWEGNVFVENGKISGIIDFERALWGDPLLEYCFRGYNADFIDGYGIDLRAEAPVRALLYDLYLYLIMIIETKYRKYDNDWQINYATKQLADTVKALKDA